MKKRIVMIAAILIFMLVTNVYAQTDIYSIQLGAYSNEVNADLTVKRMQEKGIDAFKISTSVHSVFYGAYSNKGAASADLPGIKKVVQGAFVTKLSNNQTAAYFKSENVVGTNVSGVISSASEADSAETSEGIVDETSYKDTAEEKQVEINKIDSNSLEYKYNVLDDVELRGLNGESKWFFEVDDELAVKDIKLNLFCRVNELMRRDISYVTIYMNSIPVKSMSFESDHDQLLYNWVVDVPQNLINKGYNELKLVTYSRISDRPCEDDKNIANWVVIDGETNYIIQYDRKYQSEKVAAFPKTFIGIHADDDKGIGIVIPDKYTNDEISAALTLIADLENSGSSYHVDMTLTTSSNPDIYQYDSLIYVGNYVSMPSSLKSLADHEKTEGSTDVVLYKKSLNNARMPVFLIVSDNGESLMTAVKALKNTDLKDQMLDSYAVLPQDLNIEMKEGEQDDYKSLTDMGLNGIEVQGRNQYTNIGFRIPYNKILANDANICLNLRYSDNLDFDKSMVSVYINGTPVGSHKLEREKRNLDSATFYIPEDLRRNSYYDVRVVFELIPSGIINCEQYLSSVPWAYIQEDSYVYVPSLDTPLMLLDHFPYPFSKNDGIDTTKIVMPDNPTKDDLITAGILAQLIGTGDKNNTGVIYVEKGNLFAESNNADNLIIFGTPLENSAIKKINKNLWFQYDKNYSRVLSNEKIELLPEFTKTAVFIELKVSPYSDEKGLLTITSLDRNSLADLIQYLHKNKMGFLTGDAVVVSKDGDFQTFRFQKEVDRPFYETSVFSNINTRNYLIFAVSLVLLMLLGFILYLIKNKKSR